MGPVQHLLINPLSFDGTTRSAGMRTEIEHTIPKILFYDIESPSAFIAHEFEAMGLPLMLGFRVPRYALIAIIRACIPDAGLAGIDTTLSVL